MAPIFLTGFEHGVSPTSNGLNSYVGSGAGGTPTTVSTPVRSGSYALQMFKVNGGECTVKHLQTGGASEKGVMRFAVRIKTRPASGNQVVAVIGAAAGNDCYLRINSSGTLQVLLGNATPSGPTLNNDQWYVIDMRFDPTVLNARTCDWQVDGVAQTQAASTSAEAASVIDTFQLGSGTTTDAFEAYYDDWICSLTTGDYPFGDGRVIPCVPVADGSHSAGLALIFNSAGQDVAGRTDCYTYVDEVPISETTTRIEHRANGSGNYAAVTFTQIADEVINGVEAVVNLGGQTTTQCTGGAKIYDGSAEQTIFVGNLTTTQIYKTLLVAAPGGSWSMSEVNGLVGRLGYASDANPDVYLYNIMLEVDVRPLRRSTATVVLQAVNRAAVI